MKGAAGDTGPMHGYVGFRWAERREELGLRAEKTEAGQERESCRAGPSGEAGSGKRAARLLGCEKGEEQAFGREGEGPGWSNPWARRQGLLIFFQIVFPNTFSNGF